MRVGCRVKIYGWIYQTCSIAAYRFSYGHQLLVVIGGHKTIPVGTAYAVWTGIGAVSVAILGMILFGESRDVMRIVCLLLIVSGIFGLKLVSPS